MTTQSDPSTKMRNDRTGFETTFLDPFCGDLLCGKMRLRYLATILILVSGCTIGPHKINLSQVSNENVKASLLVEIPIGTSLPKVSEIIRHKYGSMLKDFPLGTDKDVFLPYGRLDEGDFAKTSVLDRRWARGSVSAIESVSGIFLFNKNKKLKDVEVIRFLDDTYPLPL